MPRDYLTVADVLGMHTVLMQRYGGAGGVRDPGALEAALFRPQTGYYADIIAEAAALLESLAINYPFVDGNKRIAFAAADLNLTLTCTIKDRGLYGPGLKQLKLSALIFLRLIHAFKR